MVRILHPFGEVKREMEHSKDGKMDLKMGDIPILSRLIVADENITLNEGTSTSIKIREIYIPEKHIVSIGAYAANKYGHPIAVGGDTHLPLSMDKKVNRAAFTVFLDGKVKKGDLLGFLSLFPVEIVNKNLG
ncbi:hypothetical protein MBCUT_12170 [Methanobrevibacter cuticularis]|uniref:DUF22 domain-containing protein n=1 Tax=Methanobrevibacter cuticularis TaxID=47311 RepID=A0A166DS15_9EURY|nr:DUF22 domain-containing protein [Methanobrevibacter cuticularis]KZX15892.1 hypothetical protein MBCUT_12170 [Methanobrevibacter cuticularis]